MTGTLKSASECDTLPVGSIVHSAWCLAGYRMYAVMTKAGWIMLDNEHTRGLAAEYGDGWVVDWVPEQTNDDIRN